MNQSTDLMLAGLPVRKRGRCGTLIKLGISLALIGLVLYFVDFGTLIQVAVDANPSFLLPAAALVYFDRALMAVKWDPLLRAVNVRLPFFVLLRTYMVVPIAQILLPSTIGADLFRMYSLARHRVDTQRVFASMIIERAIGFVAIVLLVFLSLALAFYVMGDSWGYMLQLGGGVALTVAVGVVLMVGVAAGSRCIVPRFMARFGMYPIVAKINQVYLLSWQYQEHRPAVVYSFVLTFLEQLVPIGIVYLIVQSLSINISLLELAVIVPVTILAIRLPISFDGIGVQEGLYVVLLGLVGVSPAEALLISAFRRGLQMLCALPWGLYYIFSKGRPEPLPEKPSPALNITQR